MMRLWGGALAVLLSGWGCASPFRCEQDSECPTGQRCGAGRCERASPASSIGGSSSNATHSSAGSSSAAATSSQTASSGPGSSSASLAASQGVSGGGSSSASTASSQGGSSSAAGSSSAPASSSSATAPINMNGDWFVMDLEYPDQSSHRTRSGVVTFFATDAGASVDGTVSGALVESETDQSVAVAGVYSAPGPLLTVGLGAVAYNGVLTAAQDLAVLSVATGNTADLMVMVRLGDRSGVPVAGSYEVAILGSLDNGFRGKIDLDATGHVPAAPTSRLLSSMQDGSATVTVTDGTTPLTVDGQGRVTFGPLAPAQVHWEGAITARGDLLVLGGVGATADNHVHGLILMTRVVSNHASGTLLGHYRMRGVEKKSTVGASFIGGDMTVPPNATMVTRSIHGYLAGTGGSPSGLPGISASINGYTSDGVLTLSDESGPVGPIHGSSPDFLITTPVASAQVFPSLRVWIRLP